MDDVDAAEAIQAKHMLVSGDWVTQRLDGIAYLDKAPLKYWVTATLYGIFGIHDWVARIPTALAAILLCWLVCRIGSWAVSERAGLYAGLVLTTSLGLFLFTVTVIPDIILTLFIALTLWCFWRALEEPVGSGYSRWWALGAYAAMGCTVLTKGLIGIAFPVGIAVVYLVATKQLFKWETWRRLNLAWGILVFLLIAAPWHILATLRNPPYLDFTLHPGAHFGGRYRGFFWFYFINEQLLRFLNERWPRDYNTVPRLWFWLYHLLWFFPWSLFLPKAFALTYKPVDRPSRLRLLALCWIGVVMVFFTFSTTQEYYSMPIYPAIALLLGSAMVTRSKWIIGATRAAGVIEFACFAAIAAILVLVRNEPTPGDIANALSKHPSLYTLSLGHMADLTLGAFAYLRLPLAIAGIAFLVGAIGSWVWTCQRSYFAIVAMLVLFATAARAALVTFDPFLSSYPLADAINHLPKGTVVVVGKYNPLSSIFFYTEDKGLLVDGDLEILEYGALAPGAPDILLSDDKFKQMWASQQNIYVVANTAAKVQKLQDLVGFPALHLVRESGGKYLFSNHPNAYAAST